MIDKHFPKNHILHKIIHRKTVKISYSCSQNVDSIIASHNKKIINDVDVANTSSAKNTTATATKKKTAPFQMSVQLNVSFIKLQ